MVLQDLGRRINAAVSDLTRSANLDEKVDAPVLSDLF
jgi:signal recognition particle subunit SRP54